MSKQLVALIGYRGTGKTTVGQLLARQLGWEYVDADFELQSRAGKTIARIFEEQGESCFRDFEAEVVADLVKKNKCVLALGGGAVLRDENRRAIRSCRRVIWLQASPRSIDDRLRSDPSTRINRPNLTRSGGIAEIHALLESREPLYRQCATHAISTDDKSPRRIVDELLQLV